jgi:hypothetical protein
MIGLCLLSPCWAVVIVKVKSDARVWWTVANKWFEGRTWKVEKPCGRTNERSRVAANTAKELQGARDQLHYGWAPASTAWLLNWCQDGVYCMEMMWVADSAECRVAVISSSTASTNWIVVQILGRAIGATRHVESQSKEMVPCRKPSQGADYWNIP